MERGEVNFVNFETGYNFFHKLKLKDKIRCIMDIVEGIIQLHYHGITHNDITIRNTVMTKDRRFKIIDFDVARMTPKKIDLSSCTLQEKE
jgi:thiamine kinase-like enzyme